MIIFSFPFTNGYSQIFPNQSTELEYKVNQGDSREYLVKKYYTGLNPLVQSFIDENGDRFNVTFKPGLHIKVHVSNINETYNINTIWTKYEFNGRKTGENSNSVFIIPTTNNRSYWEELEKESEFYSLEGDVIIFKSGNNSSTMPFNKVSYNINDGWLEYISLKIIAQNGTIIQEIEWELFSNNLLTNLINLSVDIIAFITVIFGSLVLGISLAFILKKLKK